MASISDLPGELLNDIADKLCQSTDGIKDVAAMMVASKDFNNAEKEFKYKEIKLGSGVPWPGQPRWPDMSWIQKRHGRIAAAHLEYDLDYPDLGYDPDNPQNHPDMMPLAGRWESNWRDAERAIILALERGGARVTSTGGHIEWL